MCGEATPDRDVVRAAMGPSPRVRGSLEQMQADEVHAGSIPACAGKPEYWKRVDALARVHPRVCGEAEDALDHAHAREGPSPRVRGSPVTFYVGRRAAGSIPACAGKPLEADRAGDSIKVHPRVCGEARPVTTLTVST